MFRQLRSIDILVWAIATTATYGNTQESDSNPIESCDSNVDMSSIAKAIKTIIPLQRPHWVGDGFHVYPTFAHLAFDNEISPFLMLDYGAPKKYEPSKTERRGVGKHPHRGFETVTIAYQGEVEHADSVGNRDVIGPGDVQWMTAARGIIHEEFHSTKFTEKGGVVEMVQLWVNLPKKNKMDPPAYQPILNSQIPKIPLTGRSDLSDGHIRIIAGEVNGTKGSAKTHTPMNLWDVVIAKKSDTVTLTIAEGHNTIVFARKGGATYISGGKETKILPQQAVVLEQDGTTFELRAPEDNTQMLILSGEPLNEPIAARGPFVMNTAAEITQANRDYHSGKLGQ
eukprot:m.115398 g.115398  ORF g.115398 m.115398 type:complete len:340 (+) comp28419_c0_seq1:156-1175(+)